MKDKTPSKQSANEWYCEVEEQRQQIIDNAINTGMVIKAERLFEPEQRYLMVARQLSVERDRQKAFAMLDNMLQRESGAYHINVDGTKVYQNTSNTDVLKCMMYAGLSKILGTMPEHGPFALLFLEQWRTKPTHTNKREVVPLEISAPEATKLFERAIEAGLIKNTPDGLKWLKSASLFGYFVDVVSIKLCLKSSGENIPWKKFECIILSSGEISTSQQAVNGYTNKGLNKPRGFEIVDKVVFEN